jgi:acetyl-CoA acetyltransferase
MYHPFSMGETAENVAQQFNISREDQDLFAYETNSIGKMRKPPDSLTKKL